MKKLNVATFGAAIAEKLRHKGRYVKTESGASGKVLNHEPEVMGKVLVYLDNGTRLLCKPNTLTVVGYFD